MLTLQILNDDATLNTFFPTTTKEFYGGEDVDILMRIYQKDKDIRYIPDAAATIELDLEQSDGSTLTKTATFPFADDRSIIKISLTAAESATIISQTLIAKITQSGAVSFAVLQFGLKRSKIVQGC